MPDLESEGVRMHRNVISCAALLLTATAVIHPIEAWGMEANAFAPATVQTLMQVSRDIYPHDRLPDRFYAVAVKELDAMTAADPGLKTLFEEGVAQLDAASLKTHGVLYVDIGWVKDRVAILKEVEAAPFFKKLRTKLIAGLYNQKVIWPVFGPQGASGRKSSFLHRRFNDLTWL